MKRNGKGHRRLLPSPVLTASAAVHLGAAAAVLTYPGNWPWAIGAVAANHAVLATAGLLPRSRLLGPNLVRLPCANGVRGEVALTIDDGPDPAVTPHVLDLLARHGVQATFFCVGERVERYADIAREIVRGGHAVENHSQRHRHSFSLLGPRGMRDEIARAQDGISRITGSTPRFFRAPAGLRNPFLDPVLEGLSLRLASWTRRGFDTINGNPDVVFRRLAHCLGGGDILLLHDGNAALGAMGRPVILDVLPRLLDRLRADRLSPVTLRAALR